VRDGIAAGDGRGLEPWAATVSDLKSELEDRTMEKVRDAHQDDAGTALGGDRRQDEVCIWPL
jgi:hypothetical protein